MACSCDCNTTNPQYVRDGQDFQLILKGVTLNCEVVSLLEYDFVVTAWTSGPRVIVERKGFITTSKGEVEANCDVDNESKVVNLYIKASENPLGTGVIRTNIVLTIPNEKFPDGKQVVKSLDSVSNIQIIA